MGTDDIECERAVKLVEIAEGAVEAAAHARFATEQAKVATDLAAEPKASEQPSGVIGLAISVLLEEYAECVARRMELADAGGLEPETTENSRKIARIRKQILILATGEV